MTSISPNEGGAASASPYPNLLSPLRVGKHELRNRVWMAAHATLLVKDHLFTDAHVHYYVERASVNRWSFELDDPTSGRRIAHSYEVTNLFDEIKKSYRVPLTRS